MLYGKHPFYFDDVLYTPRGPWVIQPQRFHKFLGGHLGRLRVRPASRGHLGFDSFDYIIMYDSRQEGIGWRSASYISVSLTTFSFVGIAKPPTMVCRRL